MLEDNSDELFLPSCHDEDLVDNLLCCEDSEDGGSGLSLSKALLPLVGPSCPPDVPWVSTRYKTELCTSYATSGSCSYADRCQFAHGLHELHVPFRHPKYKTTLCRSYHTAGYCYYGNRCLFVHSPSEQRQVLHRRRNVPCRSFSSFGVCPFGTRCNFLHVERSASADCEETPRPRGWRPRGALCHTFSSFGFCLYGTRCRFQHGLPSRTRSSEGRSPDCTSSTSSSPPSTPSPEVHNAFTFSTRHLSDLLLTLQQLEGPQSQGWDSRAVRGPQQERS